jgi:tRNA U34 2-thiouridine synthase MnmA/TrmU
MSSVSLELFENSKINPSFIKCNSAVIQQHYDLLKSLNSNKEKFLFLEELWQQKFNISLVPSGNWKKIVFRSEKDKTLFLLKWQR